MPLPSGFASGGVYAAYGVSEALRRHTEFRQKMMLEQQSQQRFYEGLALDRFRAETQATQENSRLHHEEERFIKQQADWDRKYQLEKEELELRKRELEEVRKPSAEATRKQTEKETELMPKEAETRRISAEAREKTAEAARTRLVNKGGPTSRAALEKAYTSSFQEGFKTYVTSRNKFWADVLDDPDEKEKAFKFAQEFARKSLESQMQLLNEAAMPTPDNPSGAVLTFEDLEANVQNLEQTVAKDALTKVFQRMNNNDPDIQADQHRRFNSAELTPDEEAALEEFRPEKYKQYIAYKNIKKPPKVLPIDLLGAGQTGGSETRKVSPSRSTETR